MDDQYSKELQEIFEEYPHYKMFPLIYSVKDILKQYSNEPDDLCNLCFTNPIDWSDDSDSEDSDDINMNMCVVNTIAKTKYDMELLCTRCKYLYNKRELSELVQEILNNSYHYEGSIRFNELIKIFENFVSNPYEKLLIEYFSYEMGNYYTYHNKCKHYTGTSNACDDVNILCPYILDIIDHITNLYYVNYLANCPIQYMEILIKKGVDINHTFLGQTVFGTLLYSYLDDYGSKNVRERIDKLVLLGADINYSNPIRSITGIQYENRPNKIEKIKYLKSIGVKFDNKCITDCKNSEECMFHKMLYDTRLGNLIQRLEADKN